MPTRGKISASSNYFTRLGLFAWLAMASLVRAPSHSRRAAAARRWARHSLFLSGGIWAAIIVLMYSLDATEISWMPPRGTAWLCPIRTLTDLGKSAYVLW